MAPAVIWGYCLNGEVGNTGAGVNRGDNNAEVAIRIPANDMALYTGGKITRIQFFPASNVEYVFITKEGTDYIYKQKIKSADDTWNIITLDEPVQITGEQLYVGLGCSHDMVINFSKEVKDNFDGIWWRAMGSDYSFAMEPGKWENQPSLNTIPIQIAIQADNQPSGVIITDLHMVNNSSQSGTIKGDYLEATVKNWMKVPVTTYTLSWTMDGTDEGSKVVETQLAANASETVAIDLSSLSGKEHSVVMRVSSVNGSPNELSEKEIKLDFRLSSVGRYPRRIVMEEGTGTWCAPCSRGIETANRLCTEYPDHFVAIAVHAEDEMGGAENYEVIHQQFGSYPNSLINRHLKQDPSYPILKNLVEEEMNNGDAMISATASYTSSDSMMVKIVTETEFGYSDTKGSNYQIAYVILEDGVGPYYQKNDYSAPSSAHTDHYMDWWIHQEYQVLIKFDHVARGIYPSLQGEKGSVPSHITEGQKYAHEYTVRLPGNIDDKRNIRVAVLLIDVSSNEILNACQTSVGGENTSIGAAVFDRANGTTVYNLKGEKVRTNATSLDGLPKGLYIVGGQKIVK